MDPVGRKVTLNRDDLKRVVQMLALAMENDPLMHHFFHTEGIAYWQNLQALFRLSCEVRFELGWPVLGVLLGSKLVGVANVTEPEKASWPESLERKYKSMKSTIDPAAIGRLERYSEITDSSRPADPHYHVGVGGLLPEVQGKGLGSKLIGEIHALSEAHPTSIGVALDTENPHNVPIYQHLGYEIISETQIDDIHVWCMFRRNK